MSNTICIISEAEQRLSSLCRRALPLRRPREEWWRCCPELGSSARDGQGHCGTGNLNRLNSLAFHAFNLQGCCHFSKVLAGIDIDKADDIPLDNDKPLIVYEAAGADEVEVNF